MTIDLTRRTLLQLAGASSLAMAAAGAARAEGAPQGGGPTYANRTPMRVGMVTLRVKNLDKVANYYRDVIGLTVMERSASAAKLGTAGIALLVLEARPDAEIEPRNAAGLYHTAFLMPTRKDLARWLVAAASHRVPLSGFADHLVSESVYLDDPEGNGIEVYADRDPSQWQWSEGSVKMASDELNIPDLLSLTNARVPDYAKRRTECASATCICASATSRRPSASITVPSAWTRPAAATVPRSCRRGAIIITSA